MMDPRHRRRALFGLALAVTALARVTPARGEGIDGSTSKEELNAQDKFWARVQPLGNVTVYLEYHHFNLAQARDAWYTTGLQPVRRDETGRSGTTLGDELDFRVVWTLWKHLELMAGYGRFFPGGFVRATGPAAAANWAFGQALYSF